MNDPAHPAHHPRAPRRRRCHREARRARRRPARRPAGPGGRNPPDRDQSPNAPHRYPDRDRPHRGRPPLSPHPPARPTHYHPRRTRGSLAGHTTPAPLLRPRRRDQRRGRHRHRRRHRNDRARLPGRPAASRRDPARTTPTHRRAAPPHAGACTVTIPHASTRQHHPRPAAGHGSAGSTRHPSPAPQTIAATHHAAAQHHAANAPRWNDHPGPAPARLVPHPHPGTADPHLPAPAPAPAVSRPPGAASPRRPRRTATSRPAKAADRHSRTGSGQIRSPGDSRACASRARSSRRALEYSRTISIDSHPPISISCRLSPSHVEAIVRRNR